MKIYIQPKAKRDLKDIWHYSFKKWGLEQAHTYVSDIENGLETIANNPKIGFACDYIRAGYRQYGIRKHMIFYKIHSDRILIVRVLHESMDYKSNIN